MRSVRSRLSILDSMPDPTSRYLIVGTVALLLACGGGTTPPYAPSPPPPGNTSNAIAVGNNVFDPGATTVPPGTTVTWTWQPGAVSHNVTFDAATKSPTQTAGTYSRMFATAGTYPYQCTIHGASMSGSVTVR